MSITVPISVGEFLDKLTILRLKAERIADPERRANVLHEIRTLEEVWVNSRFATAQLDAELDRLRSVNESLWVIEDEIRRKESRQEFDQEFIALARSVYRTNDIRAAVIRSINLRLGSDLIGEKSYPQY